MPVLTEVSRIKTDNAFQKEEVLRADLRNSPRIIIAYSGGLDSAYLAYVAYQELGQEMLAVLAESASLAQREKQRALQFLSDHAIPHKIIHTDEISDPDYAKNDKQRCFYCKDLLFKSCEEVKKQLGWAHIAYGYNASDATDFRPGQDAAERHQVLRPLFTSGLTKQDIRERSRQLGLADAERPAQPCLASRLLYGTVVSNGNLHIVESVEDFLFRFGIQECRARYDGITIRIEVPPDRIEEMAQKQVREELVRLALSLGVKFVSLDLEGFVSGKLNRSVLKSEGQDGSL